jgi:hypothetical protein
MALKAILESLDDVPEALREHYHKADEGFVLQVTGSETWKLVNWEDSQRKIDDAFDGRRKAREERDALREKIEQFGDLDPQKARDALKRLSDGSLDKAGKEKIEEMSRDRIRALEEKHGTHVSEITTERDLLSAQLKEEILSGRATRALAEHRGNVKVLLPHVLNQVDVERDDGGRFVPRVYKDKQKKVFRVSERPNTSDYMGVEEYVELMSQDEDFQGLFKAETPNGSDAAVDARGTQQSYNGVDIWKLPPEERITLIREGKIKA